MKKLKAVVTLENGQEKEAWVDNYNSYERDHELIDIFYSENFFGHAVVVGVRLISREKTISLNVKATVTAEDDRFNLENGESMVIGRLIKATEAESVITSDNSDGISEIVRIMIESKLNNLAQYIVERDAVYKRIEAVKGEINSDLAKDFKVFK